METIMPDNKILNNPGQKQMNQGQDAPGSGKDGGKKKLPEFEQTVPHESEDERADDNFEMDE
jgi:hypothetical protein